MIRVLQCVNNMHRAGIETMLMNYYRHIDRTQVQFDFLMHRSERSDYDDEIEQLGGRIFRAPRLYPQNYPAYFRYMKHFFAEHPEYQIVHSHIDSMSYLPLLAAKKAGVPIRIAHSHNTSIDRDMKFLLKQYFRICLPKVANRYCACGTQAGEFLFGKRECTIIPNAIQADKFTFSAETRLRKRSELNVDHKFVVGHIGRFAYAKNHEFLVDIFAEIIKKRPDSALLMVGAGEKEEKIQQYVNRTGISDSVRFLGKRSDVSELYQAMDVFVLPSLFEGVPVVGIEAQFAGLPCFFSDKVPGEVAFTQDCEFIELQKSAKQWANRILQKVSVDERDAKVEKAMYDIRYENQSLMDYYLQMDRRRNL